MANGRAQVEDNHIYVRRVDGRLGGVLQHALRIRYLEDAALRVVEEENLLVAVGVVARGTAVGGDVAGRLDDDEAAVAADVAGEGLAHDGRRRRHRRERLGARDDDEEGGERDDGRTGARQTKSVLHEKSSGREHMKSLTYKPKGDC